VEEVSQLQMSSSSSTGSSTLAVKYSKVVLIRGKCYYFGHTKKKKYTLAVSFSFRLWNPHQSRNMLLL
jgi:hypothetical protein